MTWLRVDAALPRHPKVRRLAHALKCKRNEAIGLLVCLWSYVLEYHEGGDLSDAIWPVIAEELGYPSGRGTHIREALTAAGFLTESGTLNDWEEYQGALLTRRAFDRKRKADARTRARALAPDTGRKSTRKSAGHPQEVRALSASSPDRTNETNETNEETTTAHLNGAPGNWPDRVRVALLDGVGAEPHSRIGRMLGPAHAAYGEELLVQAAECYARKARDTEHRYAGKIGLTDFVKRVGFFVAQVRPLTPAERVAQGFDPPEVAV